MNDFETRITLLQRVRDRHDHESWQEFVQLYEPLLKRFVLSRGVPVRDADDIVQEIFATLLRALQSFEFDQSRGRFRTWLWRVARNVMVDCARRQQRQRKAEAEWCDRVAALQDDDSSMAEWSRIHKQRVMEFVLQRVRETSQPKTWTCFEEHIQRGRPAAEVAGELDLKVNAVYVNASRVLKRVRALCRELDEDLGDD